MLVSEPAIRYVNAINIALGPAVPACSTKEFQMATVTLVVTSNSDGSMTATSSATAPAQTVTSLSLTEIQTVIRGWIQQGLGGIGLS
jgi:hypothetical protein